jgi:hypothetical protein
VFLCGCRWSIGYDSMMSVQRRECDRDHLLEAVRAQLGVQRYLAACTLLKFFDYPLICYRTNR